MDVYNVFKYHTKTISNVLSLPNVDICDEHL